MGDDLFDVAIVGAGPAGSVAAYAAARRGMSVALIDRQSFPRDKTCGDGIGPGVVHIAQQLGFEEVFEGSTPIDAITVFGPGGAKLESAIPSIEGRTVEGYVIPRLEFDNRLFRLALGAGASDFTGMKFMRMNSNGESRSVEIRDSNGENKQVAARLVVGADGAYSTVRTNLNGRTPPPQIKAHEHRFASICRQ